MTANWLNALGDRNPQLLRELRGRFQPRSVLATIGIVGVLQILLLLFFISGLPGEGSRYSSYCIGGTYAVGCMTDWPRWWGDLCKTLTYIIPYALYVPGAYALVNDIAQETQKGTLNFLRLSPRSSQNILLGKFLGVPVLGYFSLLLLLPLHLISGVFSGMPIGFFVSFYLTLLAWGLLLFTGSMFAGFSGGAQTRVIGMGGASGLAIVVLIAIAWIPAINVLNQLLLWPEFLLQRGGIGRFIPIKWFSLTINQGWLVAHIFVFANIALLTYWLWRVLQRTFRKPTATVLSKRQGYAIVAYTLFLVLGFLVSNKDVSSSEGAGFVQLATLSSIAVYGSLPLIFMLSTPRQILLDWFRGQRELAIAQRAANLSPGKRRSAAIRDRIFGDKSPGVTAILICGVIAYLLISMLLPATLNRFGWAVLGMTLSMTLVANYAVLVQLMLLLETPKRYVWAFGSVICAIVLPGFCAAIPGLNLLAGYFTPGLWFLLYDTSSYRSLQSSMFLAFVAWGLMMLLLVVQGLILRHQLRQLSRSL
jgi:hypothetical protein